MFRKVLIANRGEIACRIAEVLGERGIASVAVYSEADADAPHRHAADEAVLVGAPPVAQSYLDQDAILEAARATGAEAIHPGYGLLSENAGFARRCAEAGLVFIGPSPEAIELMGDKAQARATATAAGVPVVPGSDGPVSDAEAEAIAERIGYPVLVKAAGGGGGIGMQVVKKPARLQRALDSCRDRGRSSFGNEAVYLEKFVLQPRHIEVQVLFDHHGHGVHLFERECSLQRRHQKVIEEAPSPFVTPELREQMASAAVELGKAVGYRGAGTIEYIVDPEGHFYFIEMNTRLQVEHPVTEAITGVDLIGWQLDVAYGLPLTLQQSDVSISGHAVECRIYAEDPAKKFIPRPGPVGRFEPPTLPGVRVHSAIAANSLVTPYYDPMVSKLSAHAENRAAAIELTRAALQDFVIEDLVTNRDFLYAVLGPEAVANGDFDTGWLTAYAKGR